METKQNVPNIELRSEEVQELMGKIPPAILRVGITAILCFVVAAFVVSNFVKYPEIIEIPGKAWNVNMLSEVKVDDSGQIFDLINEYGAIHTGDTLAKLVRGNNILIDTLFVKSVSTGYIYPCNTIQNSDYVNKGEVLYVVVDSIKRKVRVTAFISIELKARIEKGTPVEAEIHSYQLQGTIKSIAKYAKPSSGMYSVTIELILPPEFPNIIIWNYGIVAKIRIKEKKLLSKILTDRIK